MARLSDSHIEPTYTVFIRVPFPRGNFVDPPPVNWDTTKDDALWNILSSQKSTDIDWNDLATQFQVTVEFLAQQVKFLNDRHNTRLKDMLKGVPRSNSNAPSPIPGAEPGGEAMRRTTSGSGAPRAPSGLSIRRDSPLPKNDPISSRPPSTTPSMATGGRPTVSRNATPTTTTAALAQQGGASSPRLAKTNLHRNTSPRRRLSSLGTAIPSSSAGPSGVKADSPTPSSTPASDPSSLSSSSDSSPAQSRIIRRPPRFKPSQHQQHDGTSSFADDDLDDGDDSETPAFMPQQTSSAAGSARARGSGHDLSATLTLRGDPRRPAVINSQTSDSSTSSAAVVGRDGREVGAGLSRIPGPLSPRRAAGLSGKGKGKGHHGYSSDGTPSMGSSFSDLDDASVTQSALEEALASRMQGGESLGSRMSVFGAALRSRYIGGNQNQR